MSLTKQDLVAISHLINVSGEALEKRLTERLTQSLTIMVGEVINQRIDKLDDALAMQTEAGLEEVRDRVANVEEAAKRQDLAVTKIRHALHSV